MRTQKNRSAESQLVFQKYVGPAKMDIGHLSIIFEPVSAVKMNNKKESIFSSRRPFKKMNNKKESILSPHSAPKKMNKDEESILAGHQPAGQKDPKPKNSHPTSKNRGRMAVFNVHKI